MPANSVFRPTFNLPGAFPPLLQPQRKCKGMQGGWSSGAPPAR